MGEPRPSGRHARRFRLFPSPPGAYNRTVKLLTVACVAVLLMGACTQNIQNEEAVRQGVISHLAGVSGLDLTSMDVEIASVVFRGDEADAVVSFQIKGSTEPGSGMQMTYTLERQGSRWVVKGRADSGGAAQGGGAMGSEPAEGSLPAGHPPMGEAAPESGMPPGHPPTGGDQ